MINKAASATCSALASVDVQSPSANTQATIGNLVSVSNTSDASIRTLPLEMLYHIGSFLKLKDKVSFHQALIDAGMISLDEKEMLQEFSEQFLTQKVNILLDGKKEDYDFSKFYTSDTAREETSNLYSFLFNQMCEDFKTRKALSEEIVALLEPIEAAAFAMHDTDDEGEEVINPEVLDGERIQTYVDRVTLDEPKDTRELVDYLFPHLANPNIKKELEERIQLFDSKKGLLFRQDSYSPASLTKKLFAFIKMEEQYRGIPIKLVVRKQKLAGSHLQPIIQKFNEKMQTMPTEELRAWLIMAIDKEQVESFCEKVIEIGAKGNQFYSKGSPYYPMLKHDLLYRMNLFSASDALPPSSKARSEAYMHYISCCANDEDIRDVINSLMTKISQIQISNGEDPVSESQPKEMYALRLKYFREVQAFYDRMKQ